MHTGRKSSPWRWARWPAPHGARGCFIVWPTRIVGTLLLALGVLLITEAWLPETTRIVLPSLLAAKLAAGILLGCIIGVVSSLLGVAGGELIIPTLLFIFGADIATAGTASLVIALPAMVLGILRHHARSAYCEDPAGRNLVPSLALGAIMGAMIGASLYREPHHAQSAVGWASRAVRNQAFRLVLSEKFGSRQGQLIP